jgi:S1-C subfamily serine protease
MDRARPEIHEKGGVMASYNHYPPRQYRALNVWLVLLVLALAGMLAWKFWPFSRDSGLDPDAQPRPVVARGDLSELEKTTIAVFRQNSPSVVHITTLAVRQDVFGLDLFQIPKGTGSGFIWDEKGHVVTNYHVIQGADAARVTRADQTSSRARLVGSYPDKDLAVLVIDAPSGLHPVIVGTSHDLQVGQQAFAIGNPFGLDHSLTTGVVSALGRKIQSVTHRTIKDVIQTDAAINPGNSGGPLLDSAGRLIGVNTAIYSPSGAYAGIGFAIPVDEVNRVVPEIIRHGRVTRPGLGIEVAPDQIARRLRLPGVLVFDVVADGPAAKAGIRPTYRDDSNRMQLGDVIVAVDGKPVHSANDLLDILERHQVGDTVELTVLRDGQTQKLTAALAEMQEGASV